MKLDTEQIILETARKHFVQYGYAATRMQKIADEAGINKAMLHYYFRSKEKLYHQVVVSVLDQVVVKLNRAVSLEGDLWDKVENILDTYFLILLENPDIPFFILVELSQRPDVLVQEIQKRKAFFPPMMSFIQTIQEEMDAGNIKRMQPIQLILNILGMTIFPFIVRPIFGTVFNYSTEAYEKLMKERKPIVLEFLKSGMKPD